MNNKENTLCNVKYTKGTVNVATREGALEIPAMIAIGTGLAYHGYLNQDNTLSDKLFVVTHVHTGLYLLQKSTVKRVRAAIASLVSDGTVDWTQDNPTSDMSTTKYNETKELLRRI